MNASIILSLLISSIGILCGIPAAIFDKIDRIKAKRRNAKIQFLITHKNYGIDNESGKIVKRV